jgi:hypothetical protein
MVSYPDFVRFCQVRACEKGGLYAVQPVGLAGAPVKIGYAFNILQRLATWHYAYPQGINILAVARMNRPNDTHFGKRRALQLAEAALKHELKHYVVARDEWMHPSAKGKILETMRRLQRSLSPNLKEHFYAFEQEAAPMAASLKPGLFAPATIHTRSRTRTGIALPTVPCDARRKTVPPRCEDDPACVWEKARPRGRCVARENSLLY